MLPGSFSAEEFAVVSLLLKHLSTHLALPEGTLKFQEFFLRIKSPADNCCLIYQTPR